MQFDDARATARGRDAGQFALQMLKGGITFFEDQFGELDKASAAKYNETVMELAKAVANRTERPKWNPDSFFRRFHKL